MATSQVALLAYLGNDADFRSWGSGLSAQLAAVGMVQTADTGQINWASVTRPGTSSYGGYEIWRFPDSAEQTACPIFLKIEYGCGSVNDRPLLRAQFATGTNGAGTLTGQVQSAALVFSTGASKTSTATLPSYVSAGNGWLHIVTNLDSGNANYGSAILCERPSNGDGSLATTGFWVAQKTSGSAYSTAVIPVSGSVLANTSSGDLFASSVRGITVLGTEVALWPTFIRVGRSYFTQACAYTHNDIGELGSFTASHLGGTRTFMPMGDGLTTPTGSGNDSLAIRWE